MENINELLQKDDKFHLERMAAYDVVSSKTEQSKMIIMDRMLNRLIESLSKNSSSADKLSKRLLWLNYIIAFATIVAMAATIYQALKS